MSVGGVSRLAQAITGGSTGDHGGYSVVRNTPSLRPVELVLPPSGDQIAPFSEEPEENSSAFLGIVSQRHNTMRWPPAHMTIPDRMNGGDCPDRGGTWGGI